MKKKIFKLLTGMLLSCALAGSTVAVQAEEAGTDTVKSYLTGEDVSVGIGHRRPSPFLIYFTVKTQNLQNHSARSRPMFFQDSAESPDYWNHNNE